MPGVVRDRDVLEAALGLALEESQFFLVYKPVFELARGRMSHAEALLRWRHPLHGVIAPDLFLPALEESGLIVPLGRQILSSACARAALWRGRGRDLDVSVNLSAAELASRGIVAAVADALSWSGLEASALMLEVSEDTLVADEQLSLQRLAALRSFGVRVALDNFCGGSSRLAGLLRFPIDAIKLDRSLYPGEGADSAQLVALLARLGPMHGLDVLGYAASQRRECEQSRTRAPAAALVHA
jgi:EAL domain-containing protein (putative c-di-GMP-specific phosphodiesterase class I)